LAPAAGVAGVNNYKLGPAGPGVSASSINGPGVSASSEGGTGVSGTSIVGVGVSASTENALANAIFGINNANPTVQTGPLGAVAGCDVWGHTVAASGTGVLGSTDKNSNATGVVGIGSGTGDGVHGFVTPPPLPPNSPPAPISYGGPDSWAAIHGSGGPGYISPPPLNENWYFAGLFDGDVQINGSLFVLGSVMKGGGGFQIDHPLDPANKCLVHSFVESPDMKNIYDGVGVADSLGEVSVELPAYFDALNKEFRYQLTPIGAPAPNLHLKDELTGNRFTIAGAAPEQRVCWQVTGTRKDAWALANPIVVEREKPKSERGASSLGATRQRN
jgi:hypothetical protein